MRTKQDIVDAMERYADTVMRVCTVYLRQPADRDDAFQDTFLKFVQYEGEFNEEEHRKAWLIRVATNVCKDQLKRASAKTGSIDELAEEQLPMGQAGDEGLKRVEAAELVEALHKLDEKYRIVLYLKYYEDKTAAEIASLLEIPENTVYTNLARGKSQLKGVLTHGA